MSGLTRTNLTTCDKVDLAAAALVLQGEHGIVTELAASFGVSRPTVYSAQDQALTALVAHFDPQVREHHLAAVRVDEAQLKRTIVGLRVAGHNSLRAIESLLPIIYPGLHVSYGKLQGLLIEAEERAAEFNAGVDLSGIEAGALDEMFSQGNPVLAGVDLDSGFVFALEQRVTRAARDWTDVLRACESQGLDLKIVVKDAALGIASGVSKVFPEAEQRDDCFHAVYETSKVLRHMERRAYAAISKEMSAEAALDKLKRSVASPRCSAAALRSQRRGLSSKLGKARKRCLVILDQHDTFAEAVEQYREGLEVIDLTSGQLRSAEEMKQMLVAAAATIGSLDDWKCRKLARYLSNRAPGLVLYARGLNEELASLAETHGDVAVRLACVIFRLQHELGFRRGATWRRPRHRLHLLGACAMLKSILATGALETLSAVRQLMLRRHRASSAIEGFNAALRPHLYIHKGTTPGFLSLFQAHYNLRKRRWGRHKGTSAYECMTGRPVDDWLTTLGYPPSPALH